MRKNVLILLICFVTITACHKINNKGSIENGDGCVENSHNGVSNRDMHNFAFDELSGAYEYINNDEAIEDILNGYKNKSLVFSIELKDLRIISCEVDVFTFDSEGNLLSCEHSSDNGLKNIFLNINVKELGVENEPKSKYIDFRVEW